jgi:hypothetical protein
MLQIPHSNIFSDTQIYWVSFFSKPQVLSHSNLQTVFSCCKSGQYPVAFWKWGEKEGELKIPHDIVVDQSGTCMSQSLIIRGFRNLN